VTSAAQHVQFEEHMFHAATVPAQIVQRQARGGLLGIAQQKLRGRFALYLKLVSSQPSFLIEE